MQQFHSGSASLGESFNDRSSPDEVLVPIIISRMKQRDNLLRQRVDADEVRAFEEIAAVASQRQILGRVSPAVLSRADVFDVEGRVDGVLRQMAIL